MKSVIRYYGGKSLLASKIINLMPETEKYIEPYCGGLSILLNRKRCRYECANDIDKELIRFYQIIQGRSEELIHFLKGYDFSQHSFDDSEELLYSKNEIEHAAGWILKNRMSYGGLGENFTWSDELRRGMPRFESTWKRVLEETLPNFAQRIRNVLFLNVSAVKLIREIDSPDALFYLDPPYLKDTRVAKEMYKHEMSHADHVEMLSAIQNHRSHIFLSGYHHPLYDEALKGWACKEFDVAINIATKDAQSRRIECLWMNRPSMLQLFRWED